MKMSQLLELVDEAGRISEQISALDQRLEQIKDLLRKETMASSLEYVTSKDYILSASTFRRRTVDSKKASLMILGLSLNDLKKKEIIIDSEKLHVLFTLISISVTKLKDIVSNNELDSISKEVVKQFYTLSFSKREEDK